MFATGVAAGHREGGRKPAAVLIFTLVCLGKNGSGVLSYNPEDCLPNQGDVIRIFVGRRAVAEFDVDNSRLFVQVTPGDDVFARRIIGRQQDVHLGINPIVVVGFIRDGEVLKTSCDRVGRIGYVNVNMLVMFVS